MIDANVYGYRKPIDINADRRSLPVYLEYLMPIYMDIIDSHDIAITPAYPASKGIIAYCIDFSLISNLSEIKVSSDGSDLVHSVLTPRYHIRGVI